MAEQAPALDTAVDAAGSRSRVAAALAVLRRGSSAGSAGGVAYVVYVVALLAAVYGFPYGRTIFASLGSDQVERLARDPLTIVLVSVGYLGLLLVALRGARITGPVAPPPVWTRHVVAAPVDRALALRRWWWLALGGVVGTGLVLALFLGLSLWSAGVTGPLGAALCALVGALAGLLVARVWLAGQALVEPELAGQSAWRPAGQLRRLSVTSLLAQAERTTLVAGGALLGQSSVLREQLVRSPRAGRARLRPGRGIVLRRDLLAVRRGTGWVVPSLLLLVAGWVLARTVLDDLPLLLPVGAVLLHLGVSGWSLGLRAQADRSGAPPLLGWSAEGEALRHQALPALAGAVLPTLAAAAVLVIGGSPGGRAVDGVSWAGALLLAAALVPVCLAAVTWAAFRSPPAIQAIPPRSMIIMLILWWLGPMLLVVAVAGAAWWWGGGNLAATSMIAAGLGGGLLLLVLVTVVGPGRATILGG